MSNSTYQFHSEQKAWEAAKEKALDAFSKVDALHEAVKQPLDLYADKNREKACQAAESYGVLLTVTRYIHTLVEMRLGRFFDHDLNDEIYNGFHYLKDVYRGFAGCTEAEVLQEGRVIWTAQRVARAAIESLYYWYDRESMQKEKLKIFELFDEVFQYALFQAFGFNNGHVVIRLPDDLKEAMIFLHRGTLETLLLNMCRNAFAKGSRRMEIYVKPVGDFLQIELLDDGPGIDEQVAPRIFEEGFSGRESTGLGLALADERMNFMGGGIAFGLHGGLPTRENLKNSEGQKGANFVLTVPLAL